MLLSGIFTALCTVTSSNEDSRIGCAIATGVSITGFYHYTKLISIREQIVTHVKVSTPGDVPRGQATELNAGWVDMAADSVRYSDWLVTLPLLVTEMHLLLANAADPVWFGIPRAVMITCGMILLGSYTRLGTDELIPIRNDQKMSMLDTFVRVSGLVAFALACMCLFVILYNLLGNVTTANDPTNGWILAFSIPWIGYGIVAAVPIAVRQVHPSGYPEALSIAKDLAYGALDVWSKAVFGFWIGARALGVDELVFSF
tara:strand:+ start:1513 stop:2286 length:774 start_codon:yes stop_codon:yes gene_type:complete